MKVQVTSKPERFRRAGLEFTREPREVEVTAEQAEALRAEPMLVVAVVDGEEKKKK